TYTSRLSAEQTAYLKNYYRQNPNPSPADLAYLSEQVGETSHRLNLWFRNQRGKEKQKKKALAGAGAAGGGGLPTNGGPETQTPSTISSPRDPTSGSLPHHQQHPSADSTDSMETEDQDSGNAQASASATSSSGLPQSTSSASNSRLPASTASPSSSSCLINWSAGGLSNPLHTQTPSSASSHPPQQQLPAHLRLPRHQYRAKMGLVELSRPENAIDAITPAMLPPEGVRNILFLMSSRFYKPVPPEEYVRRKRKELESSLDPAVWAEYVALEKEGRLDIDAIRRLNDGDVGISNRSTGSEANKKVRTDTMAVPVPVVGASSSGGGRSGTRGTPHAASIVQSLNQMSASPPTPNGQKPSSSSSSSKDQSSSKATATPTVSKSKQSSRKHRDDQALSAQSLRTISQQELDKIQDMLASSDEDSSDDGNDENENDDQDEDDDDDGGSTSSSSESGSDSDDSESGSDSGSGSGSSETETSSSEDGLAEDTTSVVIPNAKSKGNVDR
ncbi:hypothetical protein HDU76_009541, partial [Blyttiomyces sp. JEL0837]